MAPVDRRSLLDALVAVYAGLLAVPVAAVLVPGGGPVAHAGVAAGVGLVFLAGARSARALPAALDRPAGVGMLAGPLGAGAAFVSGLAPGRADPAMAVGALAAAPALGTLVLAHEIRFAARRERATVEATFAARTAPRRRRGILGVSVGVAVAAVGLQVGGGTAATIALPTVLGSGAAVAAVGTEREVEVTDEGLRTDRRFLGWDRFDTWELTDDALVLHRSGRRPGLAYDRRDLDDERRVGAALDQYLSRRGTDVSPSQ